jgi:MFS family permease
VVADLARPSQRVAAFGLQRVGVNVGWAVGPALGGLLASVIDYGLVFFCAVIPLLAAALATARVEESRPAPDPRSGSQSQSQPGSRSKPSPGSRSGFGPGPASPRRELALLYACAFLLAIIQVQLFSTLSIYATSEIGLIEREIGLLYTVNGVAVVLLQVPAVALISRLGHERALVIGTSIYVCAMLAIGAATSHAGLALAILLATSGEVVVAPSQQATVAELGDPTRLGRAFGLLGTMQMLGVAFAPLLGGLLYDHLRHQPLALWGSLAALAGLLAVGYARFGALRRRRMGPVF